MLTFLKRFAGPIAALANEDPEPAAPPQDPPAVEPEPAAPAPTPEPDGDTFTARFRNRDDGGMELLAGDERVVARFAGGGPVALENAAASLDIVPTERLTMYAQGVGTDRMAEDLANFIAPPVEAGLVFDYVQRKKANVLGIQEDRFAPTGLPHVVHADPQTTATGTMEDHGLETPISRTQRLRAESTPGDSLEQLRQRRTNMLEGFRRRAHLAEVLATAISGVTDTATTWDSATNPIPNIRSDVDDVANEVGGPQNVRIVIGSTVWRVLTDHDMLMGDASSFALMSVTLQRIADLVEVPVANIRVAWAQKLTSKQGQTAVAGKIFDADEIWTFGAQQSPTPDDPSFAKTFVMMENGRPVNYYTYNPHPLNESVGYVYNKLVKQTNSNAVKRRTVSTS